MTGKAVGVLDVTGDVFRRQLADCASVGFEHNRRARDVAHRPSRSVVDLHSSVVVAADHPIAHRHRRPTEDALLAQFAGVGSMGAGGVVEPSSRLVVTRDHHNLPRPIRGRRRNPFLNGALDDALRGDDLDPAVRVRPVDVPARHAIMKSRERPSLARIPLPNHLSQPQRPDSLADSSRPLPASTDGS